MTTIHTVTLNPVIDLIYSVPAFHKGTTFRAKSHRLVPAGKGFNVSHTLAALDVNSEAYVITGKDAIHYYENFASEWPRLTLRAFTGDFATRIHCTLVEQGDGVTHIRAFGDAIPNWMFDKLASDLTKRIRPGDVVVISGSQPEGFPDWYSDQLIMQCKSHEARVYFDSSGEALRIGLEAQPHLVKINLQEALEAIEATRSDMEDEEEVLRALMSRYDLEEAVITLGEEGAVGCLDGDTKRVKMALQPGEAVDTVGCGDAFMAGLVSGRKIFGFLGEETLNFASACAASAAKLYGPGYVDPVDVWDMYDATEEQE